MALLPIMVTVLVTAWLGFLMASYAGPRSFLGNLITTSTFRKRQARKALAEEDSA